MMESKVLKTRNEPANAQAAQKPNRAVKGNSKTIEEIYQKKTQLEHILLRPDTYIGSTESHTKTLFVVDPEAGFVQREVTFVPGLYKIFDEIIVNAADNQIRDPSMDCIKVSINREKGEISVYNTGKGIPVQIHAREGVYVPELIFGHLLTSSNYNDEEKKVTGGRNGYGAKLCNIFSKKFIVETCDKASGKKYKQVFRNNMSIIEDPQISDASKSDKDYTKVTFYPDLQKFHMSTLDDDTIALMSRRVYDVAGTTKRLKVYLNNERLPMRSFKDYVNLVLRDQNVDAKVVHEVINDRWEVCMTVSDNGFQQMSFVNSIATTKGGTHVSYIADQIVSALMSTIKKKNKGAAVKPQQIRNHMWLFINCLIENPSFDSQTKENMTRRSKDFGSSPELSEKFIKGIKDTGIVDAILDWAKLKSQAQLSKANSGTKKSKISGIPKLDDANQAGGKGSSKCTLILTEGDSAKALAVSGLGVVGRDYYGVFPLRGKLLNVREASHKQIMENAEIKHIAQIMGLKFGQEYTSTNHLRYGRLMIMTDQDQDGSHIKGLLINFIHHFWPSLLKLPDFLVEFVTPIVKCVKGSNEVSFFTIPQYETWMKNQRSLKGWRIKYYKGLGTSTPQEAKMYFSHMENHQIPFTYMGDKDFHDIIMAFSKKHVEARKEWLKNFIPGTYLDHDTDAITYSDFINKELVLFSMADNVRSIPNVMDGLKPGQRKVLYACFKRNLKDEIKVAQLAGYVSEHSAYHHGEMSLAGTIVGMAQQFVGSNNLNLLLPIGQFGTRLQGGKDSASSRYIFTNLSPLARMLFKMDDNKLLSYLEDDGQQIEPEYYAPIIPMVLVNGSDGIGTGWSSSIPNFNPRDIVNALFAMIEGEEPAELVPWYKGFSGDIIPKSKDKYLVRGRLRKIDDNTIEITELPIRCWTQPYKEFLETLMQEDNKKPAQISDYAQYHTDTTVHFVVNMTDDQMQSAEEKGLEKVFKLESSISTSNMTLFDPQCRIKKYNSAKEILQDFFDVRLRLYQKRKGFIAEKITSDYKKMDNKVRFILEVISGAVVINNRKKVDVLEDLRAKGYAPFPKPKPTRAKSLAALAVDGDSDGIEDEDGGGDNDDGADDGSASDYDYLLSMPLWNLTMDRVEALQDELRLLEEELNTLLEKTPQDLWKEDLNAFIEALVELEEQDEQNELNVSTVVEKNLKQKKPRQRKATAPKRKTVKSNSKSAKKISKDADDDDFNLKKNHNFGTSQDQRKDDDDDDDDWMPQGALKTSSAQPSRRGTSTKSSERAILNKPSKRAKAVGTTSAKFEKQELNADSASDDSDSSEKDIFKGGLLARLAARKNQTMLSSSTTSSSSASLSSSALAQNTNSDTRSQDDDDDDDAQIDDFKVNEPSVDSTGSIDTSDDDWEEELSGGTRKTKKGMTRGNKNSARARTIYSKSTSTQSSKARRMVTQQKPSKTEESSQSDKADSSIYDFFAPTAAVPKKRGKRQLANGTNLSAGAKALIAPTVSKAGSKKSSRASKSKRAVLPSSDLDDSFTEASSSNCPGEIDGDDFVYGDADGSKIDYEPEENQMDALLSKKPRRGATRKHSHSRTAAPAKKSKSSVKTKGKSTSSSRTTATSKLGKQDSDVDESNSEELGSRRSRRAHKKINYAAMIESDDDILDDQGHDDKEDSCDDQESDFDAGDAKDSDFSP